MMCVAARAGSSSSSLVASWDEPENHCGAPIISYHMDCSPVATRQRSQLSWQRAWIGNATSCEARLPAPASCCCVDIVDGPVPQHHMRIPLLLHLCPASVTGPWSSYHNATLSKRAIESNSQHSQTQLRLPRHALLSCSAVSCSAGVEAGAVRGRWRACGRGGSTWCACARSTAGGRGPGARLRRPRRCRRRPPRRRLRPSASAPPRRCAAAGSRPPRTTAPPLCTTGLQCPGHPVVHALHP